MLKTLRSAKKRKTTLLSPLVRRYHQLLGGHIHSAHQQRPEPHPLHTNHASFQRDHPAGVGELQAEEASAQQPAGSPSVAHLAGAVARAGQRPQRHRRAPAGNRRLTPQAHPRGNHQRRMRWHSAVQAAPTTAAAAQSSVSLFAKLKQRRSHGRDNELISSNSRAAWIGREEEKKTVAKVFLKTIECDFDHSFWWIEVLLFLLVVKEVTKTVDARGED